MGSSIFTNSEISYCRKRTNESRHDPHGTLQVIAYNHQVSGRVYCQQHIGNGRGQPPRTKNPRISTTIVESPAPVATTLSSREVEEDGNSLHEEVGGESSVKGSKCHNKDSSATEGDTGTSDVSSPSPKPASKGQAERLGRIVIQKGNSKFQGNIMAITGDASIGNEHTSIPLPCLVAKMYRESGVPEFPSIDQFVEVLKIMDIGKIRDYTN
ncbi:hypothetical protein HAX54_017672 [Datura stramonium]|uniref:Uncharacterized protein n=1 Tax=Datura stramonium TaxID=4076 RepID=A0ABS8UL41_DATST|nr:hypothetical protein [Datura stramonium]